MKCQILFSGKHKKKYRFSFFFFFFFQKTGFDISCKLSPLEHETSNPNFREKRKENISLWSAEFSQRVALRKHAYSNILKKLPPKNENFQIKNSDIIVFIFLLKT